MASGQRRAPRPSLPLAVLLFFGSYWSLLFFIILCIELIWKGSNLPYTNTGFGLDVAIILLWAIIEPIRLHLAKQGNKSGIAMALVWQVLLSLPLAVFYAYQLALQTYVLRLDLIISSISLIFLGSQLLFSTLMIAGISIR